MALLNINNLSIGYDSQPIATGLNFQVNAGDYLCIVGENGAGKSTLIRTLLGLQNPIHGELTTGDGLQKNEIGYLPQQTQRQRDFPAAVKEIVLSGFQGRSGLRPFYSREEKRLARENMERMGILELSKRSYRELSGGQQQRVLLARALCATRKILLLDEPVAGLDPMGSREMYELIADLNREGVSIIMVSHDISQAMLYSSHILHMGASIFYGTKEQYIDSETGRYFLKQRKGGEL